MTTPTPFWQHLGGVLNGDVIVLPDGRIGTKEAHDDGYVWTISGPYGAYQFDGDSLVGSLSDERFRINSGTHEKVLVIYRSPEANPME